MKSLIFISFMISINWAFASIENFPELNCDNGKTVITRTNNVYGWGGIESYLYTSDLEFARYKSLKGYILKASLTKGLIQGTFDLIENDWASLTPGESMIVEELTPSPVGKRVLTIKLRRNPMVGCAKEIFVSGCYAGDVCVTRCIQEVNIPEEIYKTKKVVCTERL